MKSFRLRIAAIGAFLLFCTLVFGPIIVMADPPTTTPVVTTPVVAPAPVVAPVTTAQPVATTPVAAPAPVVATPEPKATPTAVTTEKTQSWWQAMLIPVLSTVGLFIAAFLAAGLRKIVVLIEKKWNVDIPDSVEKLMTDKARWALAWAEEKAESRLLYGDGKKTPGAEKMTMVVDLLEKFSQSLGYGEEWRRDKIEDLATGVLHLTREPIIGSTGARGEALKAVTPT